MSFLNRIARTLTLWLVLTGAAAPAARAQAAQTPQAPATTAAQDEYVPIDQLPESEKLPAAPYLIGAYIVVWLGLMVYVWSIWRRLARVETEMEALQRRTSGSAR